MKVILLSGGSGRRLWPLSNGARSKQFLRLLPSPGGRTESMIQRVSRQITDAVPDAEIIVTTVAAQRDAITIQLGEKVTLLTEPERRRTYPAILLAAAYLMDRGTDLAEPIVILPCDTFTDDSYFSLLSRLAEAATERVADIVLAGVTPTYPSAKYGYVLADGDTGSDRPLPVSYFTEKPTPERAATLINEGALWNGGVFAMQLGFLADLVNAELARNAASISGSDDNTLARITSVYGNIEAASFDRAVVKDCKRLAVIHYDGDWKDLGTWNTLIDHVEPTGHGNIRTEGCKDTYIINELEMPLVCIGGEGLVIAAGHDGILVSKRTMSENVKHLVDDLTRRPMYEERRWGEYKVIDNVQFEDGFTALTKQLVLHAGKSISYQRHFCRDEVWTIVDGDGEIVLDGERKPVHRGMTITIPAGMWHALRAEHDITFIEVQSGTNLVEEDIERRPYTW